VKFTALIFVLDCIDGAEKAVKKVDQVILRDTDAIILDDHSLFKKGLNLSIWTVSSRPKGGFGPAQQMLS
jgi:hypothetical protein